MSTRSCQKSFGLISPNVRLSVVLSLAKISGKSISKILLLRWGYSLVTKSVSKKELRKALLAIVYALRANYPDTYEAELRAWGFRKVSYS